MGLLDSFLSPDDASSIQGSGLGTGLSAIGMALMSGNSRAPFASLPQAYASVASSDKASASRSALKALLMQAGYSDADAERMASSEGVAKLAIQQKQQEKLLGAGADAEPALPGMGGGGAPAAPSMSPPAPAGPAAGVSLNGSKTDKAKAVYEGLIQRGLSPILAAGMTGNIDAESGFNPGAIGDKGTAFGYHQARADRSDNLRAIAQTRGVDWRDHDAQLDNIAAEFGGKDAGMAKAKALIEADPNMTPEKAAAIIAQHGERPAADALRASMPTRAGTAAQVYNMFGRGAPAAQVADASGGVPTGPVSRAPLAAPGVQVANDENQTQVLEGRMSMYPPSIYGTAASAPAPKYGPDTATGRALAARQAGAAGSSPVAPVDPADVPAQGSQEAGFVIPPGAAAKVESSVGKPPTPVSETTGATTQRAQALANFNYWGKRLRASAALGDAGKGLMEEAKIKMGLAQKFLEPSEAERLADAAGLSGSDRQQVLSGAIPGNAPTGERKDFEYAQRTPGYEEYQKRMKEAGRSQVNIDQRAEGKFEDGLGSKSADRFNTYIETGDKAKARLGDVNVLRETSRAIGGLGKAADFRAAVGPYLEAGGIKIDGLSDIQLFQSTAARLAPQLREPGAGATSDRDLAGFEKAIGSLSATPEARERILDVFEAASRNQVEAGKIARDVAAKRITRLEGEDRLQNLPDPMTSFREYRKANPDPGAPQKAEAPKPLNTTDRAVSISNAKAFLRANPGQREAVMQRLRDNGIPTDGL